MTIIYYEFKALLGYSNHKVLGFAIKVFAFLEWSPIGKQMINLVIVTSSQTLFYTCRHSSW